MILGVIPAKGKSRRVPGKNLKPLGGRALFEWTLRAAVFSDIDRVIVSSDNPEVASAAFELGADFVARPSKLCEDPAEAPDACLHALGVAEGWGWDVESVVMMLPTSPFRTERHINEALALHLRDTRRPNVLSATEAPELERKLHRLSKRGSMVAERLSGRLLLNGAIWIAPAERLKEDRYFAGTGAVPYVMGAEDGMDIDTEADFAAAEWIQGHR